MRIVLFEIEEWEREAFTPLQNDHDVSHVKGALNADNAAEHAEAEVVSTFIYSRLGADTLRRLPKLRLIATRSTDVDHIDMNYCQEHGITICNVPSYGDHTVAEHVFALLLAISHRLMEAVERSRKGDFSAIGLQGFELRDKILGVVGTGSIGRCVITIARGFGMTVLATDLRPDYDFAADAGFDYVSMAGLLADADVVTLHVPGTSSTHHLIGAEEIAAMKDGAVLINTSRGAAVDIHALLRALADGKLRAAGLDVLPEEPVIREETELLRALFSDHHNLSELLVDHILLHMNNVVITPHCAFNTREAVQRILDTTLANITAYAAGEPRNAVAEPQAA